MGFPGRFMFHIELEEGSVSFLRDTAKLYRAQFAFSNNRFDPTTVYRPIMNTPAILNHNENVHCERASIQGEQRSLAQYPIGSASPC